MPNHRLILLAFSRFQLSCIGFVQECCNLDLRLFAVYFIVLFRLSRRSKPALLYCSDGIEDFASPAVAAVLRFSLSCMSVLRRMYLEEVYDVSRVKTVASTALRTKLSSSSDCGWHDEDGFVQLR